MFFECQHHQNRLCSGARFGMVIYETGTHDQLKVTECLSEMIKMDMPFDMSRDPKKVFHLFKDGLHWLQQQYNIASDCFAVGPPMRRVECSQKEHFYCIR